MKARLIKVLTEYSEDGKRVVLGFDAQTTNVNDMKDKIYEFLSEDECLQECFEEEDLKEAALLIAQGGSWYDGGRDYKIDTCTLYYKE